MKLVSFRFSGRFGHFLRAEAAKSALTYPVPPRTALLGVIGAVLGMEKDQPQSLLEPAFIAIDGRLPKTHWHKAKFRKALPEALPRVIKKNQKLRKDTKLEEATLIWQEWLFQPSYTVWASIPGPFLSDLEQRLIERRWHFQPCLGLSEMMAELEYLGSGHASPLPPRQYKVNSVIPQESCTLIMEKVFHDNLVVHHLLMPRKVTPGRVFEHASYFMERDGRSLPVQTHDAYEYEGRTLVFL